MSTVHPSNGKEALDWDEITELARLLRQNGDKVLCASSKLSLSISLLRSLNEAFALIVEEPTDLESSFQVCNNSKIEVFRDTKFLHDFVQKTIGLKIVNNSPSDERIRVDITKFRQVKYLELKKVCIDLVTGIQALRSQLQSVVCAGRRGVNTVGQLLAACGGDGGIGFVWGSLEHLALPHNGLTKLDKSLELVPWLRTLDLSHNFISDASELNCLSNLKHVNLSYNRLEQVPYFNKATFHLLEVLVLKNNYIESIHGLQGLESLCELDLSNNCLTEHSVLWPLESMSLLAWLSLEGNPLAFHPRHRLLCIKHLHPSLADGPFLLDNCPLSKTEKLILAENRIFAIKSTRSTSKDDLASIASSLNCENSSNSTETMSAYRDSRSQASELGNSLERSLVRGRRKTNIKEAVISEDDHERDSTKLEDNELSHSYLETSTDHLETKRQILALREKFGEDNWLSSHAGTFVRDIMGMERTPSLTSASIIAAAQKTAVAPLADSGTDSGLDVDSDSKEILQSITKTADNREDVREGEEQQVVAAAAAAAAAAATTNEGGEEEEDEEVVVPITEPLQEPSYDPAEGSGDLYIVRKKKNDEETEEMLLVVSAEDVKEVDSITGKVKYRWSTDTILSCVMGRGKDESPTVDVIFDTTRKDRQNRSYFVELDDGKNIVKTIGEAMRTRPILLKVFKCMKCSTHFSQDEEYSSVRAVSAKALKCPTCQSTLVIQTDELPTPDLQNFESNLEGTKVDYSGNPQTQTLQHSESHSSIGGTEGGALVSMTTSLVHFDSYPQAQICCSANSLEESRESTPSAGTTIKKYESDIEVLSNPSQSSIEVLEEGSKTSLTPSRKVSSEERRTAVAPSLLTIPDTALIMAGLTESSSSGSLTDSICTTYENKGSKPSDKTESILNKSCIETASLDTMTVGKDSPLFGPVTNLTSMLGGLLQSMKIGSGKSTQTKSEEGSDFGECDVHYSYTDFSSVDHRVKLHIILNVFECENEELVLLLRAEILMQSSAETFAGCFVLSTSKVYVLRITGPEGEDPQRWLQRESSWTVDRLRSFAPLPFKQGILVELQQPSKAADEVSSMKFLCILQDFQRTSNFLFYVTDLSLPLNCEVEFSVPEHCGLLVQNLLSKSKHHRQGEAIRLLAIFSSATVKSGNKNENEAKKLKASGLIVTSSALVILRDKIHWLLSDGHETPQIQAEQPLSNLIEVELDMRGSALKFNFLDEVEGVEENWTLRFVSTGAAETVIQSVQPPWEELFSVPLQVTAKGSESI